MSDSTQLPPKTQALPRTPSGAEEPGLCALEDYSYLTGESPAMRALRAQLRRVAPHFRIALITGEEGTGNEFVALALHRLSADSDATFISHSAVSLISMVPQESAKYPKPQDWQNGPRTDGYTEQGDDASDLSLRYSTAEISEPITEAAGDPIKALGLEAPGSTLFLDGVCGLTSEEQAALLQVLRRLAAPRKSAERPRMIFSANVDLRLLAGAHQFDRSLYRKISAVEIFLPPLRSRPEDIPLITAGLLGRMASSGGITASAFDGRALSRLQCHSWPGNVRELEQVVELAHRNAGEAEDAAGGVSGVIEVMHLPPLGEATAGRRLAQPEPRLDRLEEVIREHVLAVLVRCSGNKVRAAERLGISRSTLYRMLDAGGSAAMSVDNLRFHHPD
jgi:DNA-binding NtrC family response regulator